MKPLVPIIILVTLLLTSGAALASRLTHLSFEPQKFIRQLESLVPTLAPTPTLPPPPTSSPSPTTPKATPKPTRKPTPKIITTPSQIPAETKTKCNRVTVTHLDGSTSRLCYNQADSNQLVRLNSQLSSAQTFYQFHLDGVNRYQQEYEKTGSSIYLDAKARSQAQADQEKEKIGQISLQIYQIEARGY